MQEKFLNEWQKLSHGEKLEVFLETGTRKGLPAGVIEKDWEKDYEDMKVNMIHEESPTFEDLMKEINVLQGRINKLNT